VSVLVKREKNNIVEFTIISGGKGENRTNQPIKVNRTQTMTPLTLEEVQKLKATLFHAFKNAKTETKRRQKARNIVLLITALNVGFRGSDMTTLSWSDLYNSDGTFRDDDSMMNQMKTKYTQHFIINDAVKGIFNWYVDLFDINTSSNSYIFLSQQNKPMDVERMSQIIKESAKAAGIKRRVATHTPRKTLGRQIVEQNNGHIDALNAVRMLLGQKSIASTMHYICTPRDIIRQYSEALEM